jgi:hypothetical protein
MFWRLFGRKRQITAERVRPMRIFVSSTCYDLLDVRSELEELLKSMGVAPILSDSKLSDFEVHFDKNSIETCLLNIETADHVIVILDKRYGPSLKSAGFDDLSATHLEYRKAVELKKPIHFYVRDRLEGDFSIWKKNQRDESIKLTWVTEKENRRLFEMLEEHKRLVGRESKNNWYMQFTTLTDLKASLKHFLKKFTTPKLLAEAISLNKFPLFSVKVESDHDATLHRIKLLTTIANVSTVPAFNFKLHWIDRAKDALPISIVPPNEGTILSLICQLPFVGDYHESILQLQYDSFQGISVEEVHRIKLRFYGSAFATGTELVSRKFKTGKAIEVSIDTDS